MSRLTPLVQTLSIDEAVLDMSGTEAMHRAPPAAVLADFARAVEREVGITISVGLAPNRLLAKLAAGRDKPRGFAVLGADAAGLLAPEPVRLLPGIGPAQARRLAALGITRLGQLQALGAGDARRLLGDDGPALAARARGEDVRVVDPQRATKSVSAETTFDTDLTATAELEYHLWRLSEKLARRLREAGLAAGGVVLKLKTSKFVLRTRAVRLPGPTVLPDLLFAQARGLLARETDAHGVPPDRDRGSPADAGGRGRPRRPGGARPAKARSGTGGAGSAASALRRCHHRKRPWPEAEAFVMGNGKS